MKHVKLIRFSILFIFIILISSCGKEPVKSKKPVEKMVSVTDLAKELDMRNNISLKAKLGKETFEHYCVICHGKEGSGDGFNAYNLDTKPANLTSESVQKRSDEQMERIIGEGGPCIGLSGSMPAWGHTLKMDEIKNIVAYIRVLGKGENKADNQLQYKTKK